MAVYQVAIVEPPDAWQPKYPLDVPADPVETGVSSARPTLGHKQALATVNALNRQCLDHPGQGWYVAVEAQP